MPAIRDFRDLIVWQRAVDFAVEVYRLTRALPEDEKFGVTAQLRRSATSVASNIAEGSARTTLKDRRHFYGTARASLKESESTLIVSTRLGFLSAADCATAMSHADETSRMLTKLRQNMRGR